MSDGESTPGGGRLLTGVAWAMLLLGLCLWGREISGGPGGQSAPIAGDVAAVGRPLGVSLPPAHAPLGPATPQRVEIPSIGVTAPVVARGLDAAGGVDPPPYGTPHTVGWYGGGTQPGARGAAVFVGHVDTEARPAVFYGLSAALPGEKIRVTRSDRSVAEFTIDDIQVISRDHFDERKVYGPHEKSRSELRLITCGGTFDKRNRSYSSNVVVSAYLTGTDERRDP